MRAAASDTVVGGCSRKAFSVLPGGLARHSRGDSASRLPKQPARRSGTCGDSVVRYWARHRTRWQSARVRRLDCAGKALPSCIAPVPEDGAGGPAERLAHLLSGKVILSIGTILVEIRFGTLKSIRMFPPLHLKCVTCDRAEYNSGSRNLLHESRHTDD